jgi:hypothetical protein
MKVVVSGSRTIQQDAEIRRTLSRIFKWLNFMPSQIVSGGAAGPDKSGESYAVMCGIELVKMPANWAKNGKAAGPIRNRQMAEYADLAIVFWDGKSAGTKNMIMEMSKQGKPCIVEMMEDENG